MMGAGTFLIFGLIAVIGGVSGGQSDMSNPPHSVPLVPTPPGGKECVLTSHSLWGRLLDNKANEERQGSGFNPLVHLDYPAHPIFLLGATGLNFEHIFNGTAADRELAMFTPRIDPVTLTIESATRATLHWPAEGSSWGIESSMSYALTGPDTLDMEFRTTPTREQFPLGYVAYMWASYMAFARDRMIHFHGVEDSKEGWTCFGEKLDNGQVEMGTVAFAGVPNLPYEQNSQALNVVESKHKRFIKPYYYGLIDGDHDMATQDDTLAYVMMFDQCEAIRFAMWNFISTPAGEPITHHPAWDWQFVIREPQIGQTYGYRARLVIRPFESREQIEALYDGWEKSRP